ncbi:MAG: rRNA maturation RNase YbeY [Planctomycetota bacterium]|jgi:rRNA maturation RNase YbeY
MEAEKQDQGIVVQIAKEFKNIDVCLSRLKKLVKAICNRFKLSKATISIAIVDDAQICKVNKRFLNSDSTTDCLSFDLSDDDTDTTKSFELVVNAEMAVKEAKLRAHSSEAELALYITHSLLHNFGFDDSRQDSLQKMHETENEILQQQGYGKVYS